MLCKNLLLYCYVCNSWSPVIRECYKECGTQQAALWEGKTDSSGNKHTTQARMLGILEMW